MHLADNLLSCNLRAKPSLIDRKQGICGVGADPCVGPLCWHVSPLYSLAGIVTNKSKAFYFVGKKTNESGEVFFYQNRIDLSPNNCPQKYGDKNMVTNLEQKICHLFISI